jgi:quinol monooxygenase YgiN
MTTLRVVAQIPAKPGSEGVVRDALAVLATASRGHQGCVSYDLFESAASPGTFVTVESWDSRDDLDAHMQTPDIASALAAADGHLAGEIAVHPLHAVDLE